jgi:hypothetical protein
MAGYTAEIALTIATTVSLGVITASMTILNFLRR